MVRGQRLRVVSAGSLGVRSAGPWRIDGALEDLSPDRLEETSSMT